jgi:hypothetical protein
MRGRKIFGDVDSRIIDVWRTGANAPTKVKFNEEVDFAGVRVKPGEYSLYTIPGKEKWTIVLNTGTSTWTANGYSKGGRRRAHLCTPGLYTYRGADLHNKYLRI